MHRKKKISHLFKYYISNSTYTYVFVLYNIAKCFFFLLTMSFCVVLFGWKARLFFCFVQKHNFALLFYFFFLLLQQKVIEAIRPCSARLDNKDVCSFIRGDNMHISIVFPRKLKTGSNTKITKKIWETNCKKIWEVRL